MKKFRYFLTAFLLTVAGVGAAATFNLFQPATGVLKGNASTYVTTAAASTDIISMWSGTCNASSFLRGDGSCQAASSSPGGSTTQVQFNNAGAFGGDNGLTYDLGSDMLFSHALTVDLGISAPALTSGTSLALSSTGANDVSISTDGNLRLSVTDVGEWLVGGTVGTNGQVLTSGGAGVSPAWATAGGGSPGGSNTQLQYNNSSAFGGTAGLTWDSTNAALTLTKATGSTDIFLNNTAATANNRIFRFRNNGAGEFQLGAFNDAISTGTNFLTAQVTGVTPTVSQVNLTGSAVQIGGVAGHQITLGGQATGSGYVSIGTGFGGTTSTLQLQTTSIGLANGTFSLVLAAGTNNNVDPWSSLSGLIVRFSAPGPYTVTGLTSPAGSASYDYVIICNDDSADTLTIAHEDAGSIAANRFKLPGNTSMALTPNACKQFFEDGLDSRWRSM